jgi:hypothetical protein
VKDCNVELKGVVWSAKERYLWMKKESTVVWSERTFCGYHEVEEGWDVRPYSLFSPARCISWYKLRFVPCFAEIPSLEIVHQSCLFLASSHGLRDNG